MVPSKNPMLLYRAWLVASPRGPGGRARGAARARRPSSTSTTCCGPAISQLRNPRRSGGLRQRQVRRLRPAEERQHRRRRRAADVPGHRHRHHHGQEGPAGLDRGRGRGALARACATPTRRRTCAIRSSRRSRCSRRRTPSNNLPAQIEIYAEGEDAYKFLFIAKGGGSANKTFLFQATPSILTHDRMIAFLKEKILTLGTAACPPYHLAIVIGGTSAEQTMKTVKLASTKLSRRPADARARRTATPSAISRWSGNPQADAVAGRRRAVRRQVFLPRRAGDPPAAPRRLAAHRARRLLLGRPPGARQDHPRRRVPGGAGAQPGEVPAGGRRGEARRRGGARSTSTGRWPEILAQLSRIRSRRGCRSPAR
jgi:hypothetical protein